MTVIHAICVNYGPVDGPAVGLEGAEAPEPPHARDPKCESRRSQAAIPESAATLEPSAGESTEAPEPWHLRDP